MNQATEQLLNMWKTNNIQIKLQNCALCGLENYCQHQGFCLDCMVKFSNMTQISMQQMKDKCQMCGAKSQETTCPKCVRAFF